MKVGDIIYVKDGFNTSLITGGRGYKVLGISSSSVIIWFLIEDDFGIINWFGEVYFSNLCDVRYRKLKEISGGRL